MSHKQYGDILLDRLIFIIVVAIIFVIGWASSHKLIELIYGVN